MYKLECNYFNPRFNIAFKDWQSVHLMETVPV